MPLNVTWLLVPDRLVRLFQKLLICWDFFRHLSLKFTRNGLKREHTQRAAIVWIKTSRQCERSRENDGKITAAKQAARLNQFPKVKPSNSTPLPIPLPRHLVTDCKHIEWCNDFLFQLRQSDSWINDAINLD